MMPINPIASITTPIETDVSKQPSDQRCFRSAWLCSDLLTDKIRPVMDRMVYIEAKYNNNITNSFLPHVTLFSGHELSIADGEAIMDLFFKHCPEGISLQAVDYVEVPSQNPPVQLIFKPENQASVDFLNNFKAQVAKITGKSIDVNNKWLHSTLMYKNAHQPISEAAVSEARSAAKKMIGSTILFDKYALVTGKAWIANDIASWSRVDARKFNLMR